ncbi:MAG: hypothetical protein H0T52_04820, partial [Lautropia sp.]|nr:hypothetical protein [Lautropia sp.]
MRQRFTSELGLGAYDAMALTGTRETAAYFEAVVAKVSASDSARSAGAAVKLAANWIMVDLAAQLNRDGLEIAASRVTPHQLARLVERIGDGTVSGKIAKDIFQALWTEAGMIKEARPSGERLGTPVGKQAAGGADAVDRIIDEKGLRQISDTAALEPLIDRVLAENDKSVQEFRAGKEKAFNALIGQVMKASRGKANPQQVHDLLRAKLGSN